jgi:hypothetical protein
MSGCDRFREALDRARDGEAAGEEAREALAHAASCPDCRSGDAVLDLVAARLRERGGPAVGAAPPGLREAVMARVAAGGAAVLDLHPFLRRAAVAAAAVFVAATGLALWQSARAPAPGRIDAGVTREDVLAQIVRLRPGPGR